MYNTLKRYPAIFGAFFGFLVYALPLAIAGVWGNFTDEKIPGWLAKRGYPSMLRVLIAWAVIGLLTSVVFYVVVVFVLPSVKPLVRMSYAIPDLSQHEHMRLDGCEHLTLVNDGPGTVFKVQVSKIDLGNDRFAAFDEIPSIAVGASASAEPSIVTRDGVPVFAASDLAHALHGSVAEQATLAYGDGRQTIDYPVSVSYRNEAQEIFQTNHAIKAYDPPIFLRVNTDYLNVKRVWFESRR